MLLSLRHRILHKIPGWGHVPGRIIPLTACPLFDMGQGFPRLILPTPGNSHVKEIFPHAGMAFKVDHHCCLLAMLIDYKLHTFHDYTSIMMVSPAAYLGLVLSAIINSDISRF